MTETRLRVRAAALLAAGTALVLALAACGSAQEAVRASGSPTSGTPSAAPTTAPTTSAATTPPTTAPTAPPTDAPTAPPTDAATEPPPVDLPGVVGGIASFASPTGNIGCYLTERGARCDVRDRTYTPPDKPASCGLAWGNALEVGADGAGFACVGDTVLGSDTILKYDNSTVIGDYGCTSRTTGVTCVHRPSGHGFTLSRSGALTF